MDYKLIGKLEDALKCPVCYGPAIDPQQEQKCGRLFCSGCIKKWQKKCCPYCRGSPPVYFPDTKSKCMLLLCTTDIMTAHVNRR